ncbi:MAG: class I SAM-dependent methyltransferase [Myxococcales bacterium]|nr:class I SAM-dependent methyltransferase [Myxococcales bacterium]
MEPNERDATRNPDEDPWAEQAPAWDTDPVVRAYADAAWTSLQAHGEPRAGARVLDFGCGTGLLSERIAPHVAEVVAVDASPAMVAVLADKRIPNVRAGVASWTPATINRDELAQGSFDLVVCSSVCAFLDDYPGTIAMLARRLALGGTFVQWDWELDPTAAEPFGLTASSVQAALDGAGLEVVSVGIGFDVAIEGARMRPLMGVGRRRP